MGKFSFPILVCLAVGLAAPWAQAKEDPIEIGEEIVLADTESATCYNPKTKRFDRGCSLAKGGQLKVLALHGDFVMLKVTTNAKVVGIACPDGSAIMWKQSWYETVRQRARWAAAKEAKRRAAEEVFRRKLEELKPQK
jgi:hypothetical protein